MKIILHMSVSADGFIAKPDGDSDWVSQIDAELFEKRIREAGCVIVGRKTFEQFKGVLYPIKNVTNIVLSHVQETDMPNEQLFFANSPEAALEKAESLKHSSAILAGGGHANGSFLNAGLVDEIFLTVHPLILNQGIKLFEGSTLDQKTKLLSTREMGEGLVELHYRVIK